MSPARSFRRSVVAAALAVATLLVPSVPAAASERLVVRYVQGTDVSERRALVRAAGADRVRSLARPRAEVVVAPDAAARRRLERDARVASVETDHRVAALAAAPDDPAFGDLWGMPDARILEAWDATRGAGLTVAVLDTGSDLAIDDLGDRAWINPVETPDNGVDDDGDGHVDDVSGWNLVGGSGVVADDHGHGTHVAGTALATAGNGSGIAGVAPEARLMTLKVLDGAGSGWTSDIADGFEYAATHGARVVNASLGGSGWSDYLRDAIARHPDVLLVAAAGNDALDVDETPQYPCAYALANVVCVAAHDPQGDMAWFSNRGATSVDLSGPGTSIRSWVPGGGLAWMSGTSMATPHVAGAAALARSIAPTATASAVRDALLSTARASAALSGTSVSGGALDAAALVAAVTPPPPEPEPAPEPEPEPAPAPASSPEPEPVPEPAPAPAPAPAPEPAPIPSPAHVPAPLPVIAPPPEAAAPPSSDDRPRYRVLVRSVRRRPSSRRVRVLRVRGTASHRGRISVRACRRGSNRRCTTVRTSVRKGRWAVTLRLRGRLLTGRLTLRASLVRDGEARARATRRIGSFRTRARR